MALDVCRSQVQAAQTDIGKHMVVERLKQATVPPLPEGEAGASDQVEAATDPTVGRIGGGRMHGENSCLSDFPNMVHPS
jgi:hypothetical protein